MKRATPNHPPKRVPHLAFFWRDGGGMYQSQRAHGQIEGDRPLGLMLCYGTVEPPRNPRKNRTAAAKAGHFHKLCGTGKPVPFVGSGSPIQLLGAGPHPVFISLGEPQAHGESTSRAVKGEKTMGFRARVRTN
jgi:hypothetical protein